MKKLLLLFAILFAFNANASNIAEGSIVKTANSPDVYIIKYDNGKQYKRLILNPEVFSSYGHLKWENIITVSQDEMNSFITSNLARVDGSNDIYQLTSEGDAGFKKLLNSTEGYDLDSVYTINTADFNSYSINKIISASINGGALDPDRITASDIAPYLSGVVRVVCSDGYGDLQSGSGVLLSKNYLYDKPLISTNRHVVDGMKSCVAYAVNSNGDGIYAIFDLDINYKNYNGILTDSEFLAIKDKYVLDPNGKPAIDSEGKYIRTADVSDLNYNITSLPLCDIRQAIDSPVLILGYPVASQQGTKASLVATDGIISSYFSFASNPYRDYYVSDKLDSGNSGGMAFSKNENGLCILGIPTWISEGNFENMGVIQNMNNIVYTGK